MPIFLNSSCFLLIWPQWQKQSCHTFTRYMAEIMYSNYLWELGFAGISPMPPEEYINRFKDVSIFPQGYLLIGTTWSLIDPHIELEEKLLQNHR